jgi:two-component system cell cycle sensor histidine kinase/response regulator CckA
MTGRHDNATDGADPAHHEELSTHEPGLGQARRIRRVPVTTAGGEVSLPKTSMGQVPMDRLRSVFDGMFDGVWLIGADQRTTYGNAAMARLLSTTQADLVGKPMTDFLDEDLWATAWQFLGRQPEHAGERIELRFRRVDGTDLFGLVAGSPITTPDGTFVGTMLNVSDMTGQRSMDAQLIQNQRLEAVGQFAGSIAHDFNNLLTAIHGYAELARLGLPDDDPISGDLDQVLVSAAKAADIVRTLLAFSRRQVLMPADVDPAEIVLGLVPILHTLLGEGVALDLDLGVDHGWVRVDPTQLEQIVVNLAVNARDAMPGGGTLSVAVRDLPLPDPERPDPDRTAGPFVRLMVSDTGSGMDDATRRQIFDPFFTTKLPGRGTGLGLSTVFGIVTQSGGQIQVETEPGRGTAFLVDLPRVRPRRVKVPRTPRVGAAPTSSGVVLLAEDDEAIRQYASRALRAVGYIVLEAADGDQAMLESQRHDGAIDVLVTDIVMPGMHGRELAGAIRRSRPGIAVVFMSGYADAAADRDVGIAGEGHFLPKPFTVSALQTVVAKAAADASIADP